MPPSPGLPLAGCALHGDLLAEYAKVHPIAAVDRCSRYLTIGTNRYAQWGVTTEKNHSPYLRNLSYYIYYINC